MKGNTGIFQDAGFFAFYDRRRIMGYTKEEHQENGGKETLLIVDDSQFQRAVFREMLGEFFQIAEAASGEECLEIIMHNAGKIDLVLLDLVMPGVDGFEVLKRRQMMEAFREIPVIVLTSSKTQEAQIEAFRLGANEYIIKPVEKSIAISRIHNVLVMQRRLRLVMQEQAALKVKAEIDEMTNLFNKSTTEGLVTEALHDAASPNGALLVVDIDNFKAVNDSFGHQMGDHVISVIAGVLAADFSRADIVGRIGGDEFVVYMRDATERDQVLLNTKEILWHVRDKERLSIPEQVTVSMGLVISDGTEADYGELFTKADEALYIAKKNGKDCFHEYGEAEESGGEHDVVLVCFGSRNVISTLEFCYPHGTRIENAKTVEEMKALAETGEGIRAVYLDLSEQETDHTVWETTKECFLGSNIPVTAICQEGATGQMKQALLSDAVSDLLLAPLEPERVTRRIKAGK